MKYTKEERDHVRGQIDKITLEVINSSYDHFLKFYNDVELSDKDKESIINQLIITATPSIMQPQYIRLEIIECWKEKFENYPFVVDRLNNIK